MNKALVFVVDQAYASYVRLAIRDSWLLSSKNFRVFVLLSMVNTKTVQDIIDIAEAHSIDLTCVEIPQDFSLAASSVQMHTHVSPVAFAKSTLANLLPKEVEYAYYLDTDILICRNIDELIAIEPSLPFCAIDHHSNDDHVRLFGVDGTYFNTGVFVANINAWREEQVDKRAMEYLLDPPPSRKYVDQDMFMFLFKDNWQEMPAEMNFLLMENFNPLFRNGTWDAEKIDPMILHFAGKRKPWKDAVVGDTYAQEWRNRFKLL